MKPARMSAAERMDFANQAVEEVIEGATEALVKGLTLPDLVVVLADIRDGLGRSIARSMNAPVMESSGGDVPILVAGFRRDYACKSFGVHHKGVAAKLTNAPPAGHFWLAVVAGGGTLLLAIDYATTKTSGLN